MDKKVYTAAMAADILHQAAELYGASNIPIDHGTGEKYTQVELHSLMYIVHHPGKNVTQLAKDWDKSKAAVSQMLKKLEAKDLIYRVSSNDSEKIQLYHPTEKGEKLNAVHTEYDERVFGTTFNKLVEDFSKEEVDLAFSILEDYIRIRRMKHYRSPKD